MSDNQSKLGLVLQKCGMSRLYNEEGKSVAVTVLKADSNRVLRTKELESDGYNSVVVAYGAAPRGQTKPVSGVYAKLEQTPALGMKEFRVHETELAGLDSGQALSVGQFEVGDKIDVRAVSKGKGFAGTIKRWNFKGKDNTHGNSINHRTAGSIGQCQEPGRVFKGKKMAGQMGNKQVCVQSLKIVEIDEEHGILVVQGGVPGVMGSLVHINQSIKTQVRQGY